VNTSKTLSSWDVNVNVSGSGSQLQLSGTSNLSNQTGMGWKLVDSVSQTLQDSGKSNGGTTGLPYMIPDTDYDLYIWGQQDGTTTDGVTNMATVPKKMKLRNNEIGDYSISYVLNGGENHPSNPHAYSSNDLPISLNEPTLSGYTFDGWYQTSNFSGGKVTSIPYGSTGDKTYYAKWTYTVTYNGNSNTSGFCAVAVGRPTVRQGTAVDFGVEFGKSGEGRGTPLMGGIRMLLVRFVVCGVLRRRFLRAIRPCMPKWNAVTYNITYELNGVAATNSESDDVFGGVVARCR
jgi:uncharacterized repeat protein (TIGR02543 family)